MKILLINNFHFRRGGADSVYLNIGQHLTERNHHVSYFSTNSAFNEYTTFSKYFINLKVDVNATLLNKISNSISYFYNKEALANLEKLVEIERPDIAHIHLYVGGVTSSIFSVLKKFKIPVVYTAHDYRLICPAYTFLDSKGKICEACNGKYFYKCMFKKCSKNNFLQSTVMSLEMYYRNIFFNPLKVIDGFIFVSDFSFNKHLKYMKRLNEKNVLKLYNFIKINEPVIFNSDYFLYFGRISNEKGISTLIESAILYRDFKLKIVGNGPQLNFLKNYCIKNNFKNIEFIGYLKGNELTKIIQNAKFVIVPSEWYENNPLTIIESYSLATPVIGADIAGISEIILEEETGYLFPKGDARELSKKIKIANSISQIKYEEMCLNAYKFAKKHFNNELNIDKLIEFYNITIESKNDKKNCK